MKPITLRNLPPDVAKAVRTRAKAAGTSLNRAVIGLLQERLHRPAKAGRPQYTDLDRFFGTWSRQDYEEFEKALAEQRQIDPEMWR
jgi:hypothetical protein